MAFIRNCILIAVITSCIGNSAAAQTVYYPAASSQLLKATAEDMAALLQKAVPGSRFTVQPYNTIPSSGIILNYNSSITDNQLCQVQSDGVNTVKFTAAEDNGLHFGIYQYLNNLGFRFYQPGSIWEIIPVLSSAFKKSDTAYTCAYKYKAWFISGGHNRWIMDNVATYNWDTYFGENGHNWALYQRRNGMLGAYAFRGHRGDVMSGTYMETLKNNPCYVANYNGSRQANVQSVPDVFNAAATTLWANTIEQKYTQYASTILGNPSLYANQTRNLKYGTDNIGIEVPDGSRWGNSNQNDICTAVKYPKESDQQFMLANATAEKILAKYPGKRFQLYAYSGHADVPSASMAINKNIDVQLIPTVYQMESSTNGLRNRWYNRTSAVSEYQYLNLSGWSYETPSFSWNELKNTLQIAKEKKSQGIIWEASPAKFGSLPYLLAANANLKDGTAVDETLQDFCNNLFGDAAQSVYKMMMLWGAENTAVSKHKLQLYLQLMQTIDRQTQNAEQVVKERVKELKAYVHYMVMVYDLAADDRAKTSKDAKDAALCIYLAKTNRLQLVNSYYVITTIAGRYGSTSEFYSKYNAISGTAYANGTLPLITAEEIENNFKNDISSFGGGIESFKFETAETARGLFKQAAIEPLSKINVQLEYTNGANYYNKTTFNIAAPAAGKFTIDFAARFDMPDKGYMNFLVESADKALLVVKDYSIDNTNGKGSLTVTLPEAGNYLLTVVSKYKTAAALTITTNGNYFYKNGAFLGSKTENYRSDAASLPGYFYIPQGIDKIYFNVANSFSNGKYAAAATVGSSFAIKDHAGNLVQARFASAKDSTLFYFDVPAAAQGQFWQATNMGQYNLQFVNIANTLWYAQPAVLKKNSGSANVFSFNHDQVAAVPVMFPNPSTGIYNCMLNGSVVKAEEIAVYNLRGTKVAAFKNAAQFNITGAASGMYLYQLTVNGTVYKGKVIKQ